MVRMTSMKKPLIFLRFHLKKTPADGPEYEPCNLYRNRDSRTQVCLAYGQYFRTHDFSDQYGRRYKKVKKSGQAQSTKHELREALKSSKISIESLARLLNIDFNSYKPRPT